jgi:hypothetical protein
VRIVRWLAPAATTAAIAVAAAACAFLSEAEQCGSDSDCGKYNAVCDTVQSICVARGGPGDDATSGADGAPPVPGPPGEGGPIDPKCNASPKEVASATAGLPPGGDGGVQVSGSLALGCEKDWTLDNHLVVGANATLTIAAGTTIRAKKGTGAAIIVLPGGKILAQGQKDAPVVLTSDDPAPRAGDWRGVFVLGNAPRVGTNPFDGDPLLSYGGTAANDASGTLEFVRIEYAQSGLVLGGVGTGTKIDSVQVRQTNDNCFVFTGGTVDARHLVCQQALDEQFEIALGYRGKLQFLFGQRVAPGDAHHAILVDGQDTAPVIYNATLCGQPEQPSLQGHGLVFRNNAKIDVNDVIITGWLSGLDAQSANLGAPILLRSSILFGNNANPAFTEDDAGAGQQLNDDNGFDEVELFRTGGNVDTNPNLVDCHNALAPKPWPKTALATGARVPPDDGFFDKNAAYIGAFRDENDAWMTGAWVRFAGD